MNDASAKPGCGAWAFVSDERNYIFGIATCDEKHYYLAVPNERLAGKNSVLICQSSGGYKTLSCGSISNGLETGIWTRLIGDSRLYRWYALYKEGKDISNTGLPDFAGESIHSLEYSLPTEAMLPHCRSTKAGVFDEGESASAVWILRNDTRKTVKILNVLWMDDGLGLEYRRADGTWAQIGEGQENLPFEIPPGTDGRIRVTCAPFSRNGYHAAAGERINRWFEHIYFQVEGYDDALFLTVEWESRPLVAAERARGFYPPTWIRREKGEANLPIEINLAPRDADVVAGVPFIQNAVLPAVVALDTNALPWTLRVSFDYPADYVGTIGGGIVLPIVSPPDYPSRTYNIWGKVGDEKTEEKIQNPTVIEGEEEIRKAPLKMQAVRFSKV
jgi:hypothetical protein